MRVNQHKLFYYIPIVVLVKCIRHVVVQDRTGPLQMVNKILIEPRECAEMQGRRHPLRSPRLPVCVCCSDAVTPVPARAPRASSETSNNRVNG